VKQKSFYLTGFLHSHLNDAKSLYLVMGDKFSKDTHVSVGYIHFTLNARRIEGWFLESTMKNLTTPVTISLLLLTSLAVYPTAGKPSKLNSLTF